MNFKFQISNFKFPKLGSFFFLLLLSLIPLIPLIRPGLPITHDGQDHVARIANFYDSLTEGNIVPRWAENLNWGYGHPILMFLYPLPSYIASLFHVLGISFIDSTKLVFALAFVASGITMYVWLKEFLRKIPSLGGAVLYLFAPYRFVDLYVRGAIGEHVAFIFPPLVFYFLLKLSKKYSFLYIAGGSLSLAGLILSHNAITVMFLPFILAYGSYLLYFSKNRKSYIINLTSLILLGLGLSSFFLLPAFLEGKYTLRDIVTAGEYVSRFVRLDQLIFGPWSYGGTGQFTVQLGIVQWILVACSLFTIRKLFRKKKQLFILYFIAFTYLIVSMFLMLRESDFIWRTFTVLQKFQFPWRFLSVSVFSVAIVGSLLIAQIDNRKLQKVIFILILVGSLIIAKDYWQPKGYLEKSETFYTGIYEGTTDTGESSPRWSIRFMEVLPKAQMEVIEGEANIEEISRTSTNHVYKINSTNSSRIAENTLYFPGWKVFIDGKEYKGVQYQDPAHRGLITFYINNGRHIVAVKFEDTRLRRMANLISLLSISGLIIFGFVSSKFSIFKN